jgi:hypothetical protein
MKPAVDWQERFCGQIKPRFSVDDNFGCLFHFSCPLNNLCLVRTK